MGFYCIHAGRGLLLCISLLLSACSGAGSETSAPAALRSASAAQPELAPTSAPGAFEAVSARGTGFAVGENMMAAKMLYVFFDPQCPHCSHLWETTQPLARELRIVWMPVAFINAKSAGQGAAILAAADPAAAMQAHEARLAADLGGMEPPARPDEAYLAKVRANTALWQELHGSSVPMLVFKDPASGQSTALEGALETDQLRELMRL